MRPITLTRRTAIIIVALSAIATLASAAIMANYLIQNTVTITSSPHLTVYESDGSTVIAQIQWGDVQQSTSGTHQVILKDTGGASTPTMYIVDTSTRNTATGVTDSVSSLNPTGLPTGVSISWNFASIQTGGGQPFQCVVNGVTYQPCMALTSGTGTPAITLTLSVDNSAIASTTPYTFSIEFDSYQTPTG